MGNTKISIHGELTRRIDAPLFGMVSSTLDSKLDDFMMEELYREMAEIDTDFYSMLNEIC